MLNAGSRTAVFEQQSSTLSILLVLHKESIETWNKRDLKLHIQDNIYFGLWLRIFFRFSNNENKASKQIIP